MNRKNLQYFSAIWRFFVAFKGMTATAPVAGPLSVNVRGHPHSSAPKEAEIERKWGDTRFLPNDFAPHQTVHRHAEDEHQACTRITSVRSLAPGDQPIKAEGRKRNLDRSGVRLDDFQNLEWGRDASPDFKSGAAQKLVPPASPAHGIWCKHFAPDGHQMSTGSHPVKTKQSFGKAGKTLAFCKPSVPGQSEGDPKRA